MRNQAAPITKTRTLDAVRDDGVHSSLLIMTILDSGLLKLDEADETLLRCVVCGKVMTASELGLRKR
jgi:hypothetical protein